MMQLVLTIDPPDLSKWLTPEDRGALRRARVSMALVRSSYAALLLDVMRAAYPHDRWKVEVRRHPTGDPVIYGRPEKYARRVTFNLTDKHRAVFQLCEIAWKSSVGHITLRFAVAAAQARR